LQGAELGVLTLTALITISVSSYFITYNEQIYRALIPFLNLFGKEKKNDEERIVDFYDVWVLGYHRIGWKVCESLEKKGIKFAVVDFNPESIKKLKRRGIPAFFGDVADVEFLSSIPIERSKLIISTIPAADDQKTMISHVRGLGSKAIIIANLYHNNFLEDLYEAGANYVMMPHLLGGQWISDVLVNHNWNDKVFDKLRKEQREEMKQRFVIGTHI